jgi:hypothetical protein
MRKYGLGSRYIEGVLIPGEIDEIQRKLGEFRDSNQGHQSVSQSASIAHRELKF